MNNISHTARSLDRHHDDDCMDILYKVDSEVKWVPYDKSKPSDFYEKVHYDTASDVLVLRLISGNNTYARVTKQRCLKGLLDNLQSANVVQFRAIKCLSPDIDHEHPPKSYDKAMALQDRQEWANAYDQEFQVLGILGTETLHSGHSRARSKDYGNHYAHRIPDR